MSAAAAAALGGGGGGGGGGNSGATLLWAVTSLDAVPAGSVLINPQSGQPFYNADGSPYRFDPHQPLPFQIDAVNGSCQQLPIPAAAAAGMESLHPELVESPYDGRESIKDDDYE